MQTRVAGLLAWVVAIQAACYGSFQDLSGDVPRRDGGTEIDAETGVREAGDDARGDDALPATDEAGPDRPDIHPDGEPPDTDGGGSEEGDGDEGTPDGVDVGVDHGDDVADGDADDAGAPCPWAGSYAEDTDGRCWTELDGTPVEEAIGVLLLPGLPTYVDLLHDRGMRGSPYYGWLTVERTGRCATPGPPSPDG